MVTTGPSERVKTANLDHCIQVGLSRSLGHGILTMLKLAIS